jgi:hypothetical protein
LDLSISSSVPTIVGAGGLTRPRPVTGREDEDAGGLAGAVRQVDGAADHLVGLARVDAEAHGDLDGRVELLGEVSLASGRPRAGRTARSRSILASAAR